MRKFAFLAFVLMVVAGCASPVSRKSEPAAPQTGFAGQWETPGPVDTGPTFGTTKVRLEIDPNGAAWRIFWHRPDGELRAGMGGQTWVSLEAGTALLRQASVSGGLRLELIDARTIRSTLFENAVELHRVDRRG